MTIAPDPVAILAALGVTDEVARVTPVAGGWDTAIWQVQWRGASYALRVFRPEQAAVAAREVALLQTPIPGVPVPQVRRSGLWQGRPALLIDWCQGQTLLDAVKAAPQTAWSLALAFGRIQAQLHAAAPPAALLVPPRPWVNWAAGGRNGVAAVIQQQRALPPSILHFDYHPLNVLVEGTTITGVIDWANVQVGDRRADVARTLTILRLVPPGRGPAAKALHLAARLLAVGWRQGYRQVAGPLPGMAPFYAWAGQALLEDLASNVADPANWLTEADLQPARRWTAHWRQRIGLPAD